MSVLNRIAAGQEVDLDIEQRHHLKLAFALEYASRIAAADGVESFEEFQLFGQVFTRPLLRQAGFLGEDGHLTPRFGEYRDMAHNVLPGSTDGDEKREIFELLYAASAVDGMAEEEVAVLIEAGVALGMEQPAVVELIGALSAAS